MQIYDVIEEMAQNAGMSIYGIEHIRGKGNYLASSKSHGRILKCNTMSETAELCGYKLALVPKESISTECLVIEPEQETR